MTGMQETAVADATIRRVTIRLSYFLGAMFFVNWLDRVAISFAGPSGMNRDLGLDATAFGFAASVFFVGYLLLEVPSNLALHRFGARRWLARIMVSWGVVTALFAFVTTAWQLDALRVLLGATEAGFFPGAILFLSLWVPTAHRSRVLASFYVAQPLTIVFGAPLASLLIDAHALTGIAGWRTMYAGVGALAVLMGVVTFVSLPDRPAEARWLSVPQREWLVGALAAEARQTERAASHGATVRDAVRSGRVWLLAAVYFGIIYGLYALSFFLPTIIAGFEHGAGRHFGVMQRGLITAMPYIPAAIVLVLWSRDASRRGTRRWHVGVPTVVGGIAVPLALLSGSPVAAIALMAVVASAIFAALPPFWSLPARFLTGRAAAAGIALINTVGNIAGVVAPYTTGWFRTLTHGYEAPMCVVGLMMVLSGLLAFALPFGAPGGHGADDAPARPRAA